MFGETVDEIQANLEGFILRGTIKAKIDATTNTLTFVQSDERHVAYAAAVGAAERAVALSQEIVLRSNGLLSPDAAPELCGFSLTLPFLSCDNHCLVLFIATTPPANEIQFNNHRVFFAACRMEFNSSFSESSESPILSLSPGQW